MLNYSLNQQHVVHLFHIQIDLSMVAKMATIRKLAIIAGSFADEQLSQTPLEARRIRIGQEALVQQRLDNRMTETRETKGKLSTLDGMPQAPAVHSGEAMIAPVRPLKVGTRMGTRFEVDRINCLNTVATAGELEARMPLDAVCIRMRLDVEHEKYRANCLKTVGKTAAGERKVVDCLNTIKAAAGELEARMPLAAVCIGMRLSVEYKWYRVNCLNTVGKAAAGERKVVNCLNTVKAAAGEHEVRTSGDAGAQQRLDDRVATFRGTNPTNSYRKFQPIVSATRKIVAWSTAGTMVSGPCALTTGTFGDCRSTRRLENNVWMPDDIWILKLNGQLEGKAHSSGKTQNDGRMPCGQGTCEANVQGRVTWIGVKARLGANDQQNAKDTFEAKDRMGASAQFEAENHSKIAEASTIRSAGEIKHIANGRPPGQVGKNTLTHHQMEDALSSPFRAHRHLGATRNSGAWLLGKFQVSHSNDFVAKELQGCHEQSTCSLWGNRCAQCAHGAIIVLNMGNQCAECGAINVLTMELSMCSVWSNRCAQCGAINVLSMG